MRYLKESFSSISTQHFRNSSELSMPDPCGERGPLAYTAAEHMRLNWGRGGGGAHRTQASRDSPAPSLCPRYLLPSGPPDPLPFLNRPGGVSPSVLRCPPVGASHIVVRGKRPPHFLSLLLPLIPLLHLHGIFSSHHKAHHISPRCSKNVSE